MKDIFDGGGSFEELRKGDFLYVDKTRYLCKLIRKSGSYYFLARPRRFGKSMTISTLDALFRGKRELFKGLYIDSTDYDWKEYPVIHMDFSLCQEETKKGVSEWINDKLLEIANEYGVELKENKSYSSNLDSLITRLAKKEKAVILIDEYDSLLSNNINNNKLEKIRDVLRGFYSVIKASSKNIRFCLITGVTKFSKVSIFSSMNNLVDISQSEDYATMLGYTQSEMEDSFSEYIDYALSQNGQSREEYLKDIKHWYNGYRFAPNAETVYNPVSIGLFFNNKGIEFYSYWMDTGGSSLLSEVAKRVSFNVTLDLDEEIANETLQGVDIIQMAKTEVNKDNFLSLLYQSGYLTIKSGRLVGGKYLFRLGYPNAEVEQGFCQMLVPVYLGKPAESYKGTKLLGMFYDGKVAGAMTFITSIFSSIPYHEINMDKERLWHAGFLCILKTLGAAIESEVATNIGRIDAVLTCPEHIYVIEFKYNKSAAEAISQIKDKKYYERYLNEGKKIHLLGINFSLDDQNVIEWKEEVL